MVKFYRLHIDIGKKRRFAIGDIIEGYEIKKIDCPVCDRKWTDTSLLDKLGDITINLTNINYPDFLSTYVPYFLVVSERVLKTFLENNIGKFEYKEMKVNKVEAKKGKEIPKPPRYYRLLVKGKGGKLLPESNIILKERCDACGYERYISKGESYIDYQNLYIDEKSWDGSDLFRVEELPAVKLCTKKVVDLCLDNEFRGMYFTRTDEGPFDSDWFWAKQAKPKGKSIPVYIDDACDFYSKHKDLAKTTYLTETARDKVKIIRLGEGKPGGVFMDIRKVSRSYHIYGFWYEEDEEIRRALERIIKMPDGEGVK